MRFASGSRHLQFLGRFLRIICVKNNLEKFKEISKNLQKFKEVSEKLKRFEKTYEDF